MACEKALEIIPTLVIDEAKDLKDLSEVCITVFLLKYVIVIQCFAMLHVLDFSCFMLYIQVKRFLRSAITSKQYDNEEIIADLVAKACGTLVFYNSLTNSRFSNSR